MARTQVKGQQVEDGSIQRVDLDTTTLGQAVITRILPGAGVAISSTGVDSGTGDVTIGIRQYVHTQVTPETQWTMTHEFVGYPEVIVMDTTGERVYCDLYYPDSNTVIAEFGMPFSGRAVLTIS